MRVWTHIYLHPFKIKWKQVSPRMIHDQVNEMSALCSFERGDGGFSHMAFLWQHNESLVLPAKWSSMFGLWSIYNYSPKVRRCASLPLPASSTTAHFTWNGLKALPMITLSFSNSWSTARPASFSSFWPFCGVSEHHSRWNSPYKDALLIWFKSLIVRQWQSEREREKHL